MPSKIFPRWRFALAFVLVLSCLPFASSPFGFLAAFALAFGLSCGWMLALVWVRRRLSGTPKWLSRCACGMAIPLLVFVLLDLQSGTALLSLGTQTPTLLQQGLWIALAVWLGLQGSTALYLTAVPLAWLSGVVLVGSLLGGLSLATAGEAASLGTTAVSPALCVHLLSATLPLAWTIPPKQGQAIAATLGGSLLGAAVVFGTLLLAACTLGTAAMAQYPHPVDTLLALLPLCGTLQNAQAVYAALLATAVALRLGTIGAAGGVESGE